MFDTLWNDFRLDANFTRVLSRGINIAATVCGRRAAIAYSYNVPVLQRNAEPCCCSLDFNATIVPKPLMHLEMRDRSDSRRVLEPKPRGAGLAWSMQCTESVGVSTMTHASGT
jgi:hypothetical protein